MFGVVQDCLDQGLKSGVVRLEVVNILLVYTFAAMIGVGIVDAFSPVD